MTNETYANFAGKQNSRSKNDFLKGNDSRIVNVPNTDSATYMLTIEAETQKSNGPHLQYIFPISPSQITSNQHSYNTYYDIPSSVNKGGVHRLIDEYGIAPPVFTIQGTTGWNKLPSSHYTIGGLQAFRDLEDFIKTYNSLNIVANRTQIPGFKLAFLDFWYHDYWYVTPMGPIRRRQSERQPLLVNYELDFAAYEAINQNQSMDADLKMLQDTSFHKSSLQQLPATIAPSLRNTG